MMPDQSLFVRAQRAAAQLNYREVRCDSCHGSPRQEKRDFGAPGGRGPVLCSRCDGLGVMWIDRSIQIPAFSDFTKASDLLAKTTPGWYARCTYCGIAVLAGVSNPRDHEDALTKHLEACVPDELQGLDRGAGDVFGAILSQFNVSEVRAS
jgi:hypothetical protein